MRLRDIELIYDFNCWANRLLLARTAELTPAQRRQATSFSWGSVHDTLLHLLDAEHLWRILCSEQRFSGRLVDRESFPDLEAIAEAWENEEREMRAFLGSLEDSDLDGSVRYQAEGRVIERVLWQCLWHMVNHGTQHRSQVAAMLRDFDHSPGSMDFTYYLNRRKAGRG